MKLWFIAVCLPVMVILSDIQVQPSNNQADYNSLDGHGVNTSERMLGVTHFSENLINFNIRPDFLNEFSYHNKPGFESNNFGIPENYDARIASSYCATISTIRDQSSFCGSCWAVSVASMISARFCVATKGRIDRNLSADYLLRCCDECKSGTDGCVGGDPVKALHFLQRRGIVTGGEYGSEEGCMPYSIKPCTKSGRLSTSCINNNVAKPGKCYAKCTNKKYPIPYKQDIYYALTDAENPYGYGYKNIAVSANYIKRDILDNGPSIAYIEVYDDFLNYRKGIYYHKKGKFQGLHVLLIIGWGVENGIEYWLVSNSWGTSWGENGVGKINHRYHGCNFGKLVFAVFPKV